MKNKPGIKTRVNKETFDLQADSFSEKLLKLLKNGNRTIAIKGEWGSGKTYYWNKFIASNSDNFSTTPCYVSCFNVSSIAELKEKVLAQAALTRIEIEEPKEGEGGSSKSIYKNSIQQIAKLYAIVPEIFKNLIQQTPKLYAIVPETYKKVIFEFDKSIYPENWVICIDDLERLPKDIDISLLMGYLTYLRDECNLRVVIIYNEQAIASRQDKNKDIFFEQLEKTVDFELTFKPNISLVVDLVLSDYNGVINSYFNLEEKLQRLGINNIRIVRKLLEFYSDFKINLQGILGEDEEINPYFLISCFEYLLLFTWIKYSPKHKSLSEISCRSILDHWPVITLDEKEKSELYVELSQTLHKYFNTNILPRKERVEMYGFLINLVDEGDIDDTGILDTYKSFDSENKNDLKRLEIAKVKENLFFGSFQDDAVEQCITLFDVLMKNSSVVNLSEADYYLTLFNRVGTLDQERDYMNEFFEVYSNSIDLEDTLTLMHLPFKRTLIDLIKLKVPEKESLRDLLFCIYRADGYYSSHPISLGVIEELASYNEGEFFSFFSKEKAPNLTKLFNHLQKSSISDKTLQETLNNVEAKLFNLNEMNSIRLGKLEYRERAAEIKTEEKAN